LNNAGRLFLLSVVPLAAACAGLFWFFIVRFEISAERAMERRAVSTAEVVARASSPAVVYVDAHEAEMQLGTIRQAPDVAYAVVLEPSGHVLAALAPERRPEVIMRPDAGPELRWTSTILHVTAPIDTLTQEKGTLAMGFSLDEFHAERRGTMLAAGAAVGMVLLGGGILSWLMAYYLARRRAAEAAQRRSEESFRALIETLPDAILIERNGTIVYSNPAAVRYLAVAHADEIHGRPAAELLAVDALQRESLRLERIHEGAGPLYLPEAKLLRRDGTSMAAEVLALPLVFDGAPAGVLVARDLTERRRIQAQLIHADRMASMGTMAAGVAHEINNPLAYVTTNLTYALGALETLGRDADDDELRQALSEALEGAERVRHIVLSLKAYSRAEDETVVAVDVERALDAAISIARAEVKPRAELLRHRGDVAPVAGQESRLVQVFVNLLTNAAQAIPPGEPARNLIEVSTSRLADGRVVVTVADTGGGISPDHLPHLFDPFFTTKPVGEGTGLGLSICQGIIHGLGGEIRVHSRVGEGSRFEVVLRSSDASPCGSPTPETPTSPLPSAPHERPRMLVVDDEIRIAQSIERLFSRDLRVVSELDGRRALKRLRDDRDFDVIVCDLMMPEMSGIELFDEIRRLSPRLARRVIFLTGGAFTAEATAFLDSVRNPVVEKPFEVAQLRAVIDEVLRRTGEQLVSSPPKV
jgi:two-component system cell cycle sensor histidine kinase/response regulator CckA